MTRNLRGDVRRIITRGVIDMATSAILESDSYLYRGPMALADDAPDAKLMAAIETAMQTHFKKVNEVLQKHEADLKQYGTVQDGTKAAIAELNEKGGPLFAQYKIEKEKADARILALEQKLITSLAGGRGGARLKSVGEMLIESEEWKAFAAKGGNIKHSMQWQTKTITSNPASGGGGAFPEFLPTPVIPAFQPLTVRDLLDTGTTETNLINWVRELLFTNAAAVVSEGAVKPQSDITYERLDVPVRTIAHWIKASKQILADFKQLATLINGRLTFGLKLAEEKEILFGDGTGDHLDGLVPQATAFSGAFTKVGDTRIDIIRHAMLQVQLAFYPSTGIVMSPVDWHALELTKDHFGRYILAAPASNTPGMLWGLPVVQCYSFAAGDFLVGAFKLAATLFDREVAQILVSNEDNDNFTRNMVTILCEERLALAVTRPAAFVFGAFPTGTST
jgi:HK97 family phage major capsid protein